MSSNPIFDEFDPELYAHAFALFTGYDLDEVWWRDKKQLWSSLQTPDGEPLQLPTIEDQEIKPPKR